MLIGFWLKKYPLRRFRGGQSMDGYGFASFDDLEIVAHVQTTDRSTRTFDTGDYTTQKLVLYTNDEVMPAEEAAGVPADMLLYRGKWYECRSAVLSDNTMLTHWTSTWVRCMDQDQPPWRKKK